MSPAPESGSQSEANGLRVGRGGPKGKMDAVARRQRAQWPWQSWQGGLLVSVPSHMVVVVVVAAVTIPPTAA